MEIVVILNYYILSMIPSKQLAINQKLLLIMETGEYMEVTHTFHILVLQWNLNTHVQMHGMLLHQSQEKEIGVLQMILPPKLTILILVLLLYHILAQGIIILFLLMKMLITQAQAYHQDPDA